MTKMAKYRYAVIGNGQFPNDMLRYDRAKVVAQNVKLNGAPSNWRYTIIEGECAPTIGRWQSFLWSVALGKMRYPGNDPENGPAEWHYRVANQWCQIAD